MGSICGAVSRSRDPSAAPAVSQSPDNNLALLTAVGSFTLWGAVATTRVVIIIILLSRVVPVVILRLLTVGVLLVCCLDARRVADRCSSALGQGRDLRAGKLLMKDSPAQSVALQLHAAGVAHCNCRCHLDPASPAPP